MTENSGEPHAQSKHEQLLSCLERSPAFSSCSRETLLALSQAADFQYFPSHHCLIREGEFGNEAYVLLKGTCSVKVGGKSVGVLSPSSVFGELGLVSGGRRYADVWTLEEVELAILSHQSLHVSIRSDPNFMKALVHSLNRYKNA